MRTDKYPTRLFDNGRFINRSEPVACERSSELSDFSFQVYIKNGYIVLQDFFNKLDIGKLHYNSDKANGLVTNDTKINAKRSTTGFHDQEPFKAFASNKNLVGIVKGILGSDVYIHQSRMNYKLPGANGWYWHSDFETWHAQDGMPEMRCLTAMIPLTENDACNGPLLVIPGSHKLFYSCRKEKQVSAEENFADQKEGVPTEEAIQEFYRVSGKVKAVLCSPGDLVLFDCNIIHGSVQNMAPYPRTNMFIVYNSIENKLVEPFSAEVPRPEEFGARKNVEVI